MAVLQETLSRLRVRAIISRGWADYISQEKTPDIFFAGQLPHEKLFPRVAAVIHHGGAGTTHTAARAGVPQLLIPHLLDQFYWAERIHKLSIGPAALPRSKLTTERLTAAIREAIDNTAIRKNAAQLSKRLLKEDGIAAVLKYLSEARHISDITNKRARLL
jgi:UDP:flavonoid glycosyltransferase YjiC (YdhE family)